MEIGIPFLRREPPFLRGVQYFGLAQPRDFWGGTALEDAPAQLKRIRADGFNTVIFVVPWRGFRERSIRLYMTR